MSVNDRVKKLRQQLGKSQSDFAEAIGIGQRAVSQIEKNVNNVTEQNINLICLKFGVNEKWLRTGEGEIFNQITNNPMDDIAEKYQLAPDERIIVETYLKFPAEGRQKIVEFIKECAKQMHELKEKGLPITAIDLSNLLEATFCPTVTVNELNNTIDELTRIRNHKLEQQSSASQPTESESNSPKIKTKI